MTEKYKRLPSWRLGLMTSALALSSGYVLAQEAPVDEDQNQEATALEDITVMGDRAGPVGPDRGYLAERSLTATKTDTPLSETPRSVSVTTRQQIEDMGAMTLSDVLNYMPGVSAAPFAAGDGLAGDIFYIRGMNQRDFGYGTYRDGLRVQANAYATSAEVFGLERVEVLKGPTAILYGENVPGGLVNMVSKRPTQARQGEINLSYGTHSRKQISIDVSGALTDDGRVLGRLVMLNRDADTQTDSMSDDRFYIAPSLTFKMTEQDTLTLLAQYQKDDTELQLGLPAYGTLYDNPHGGKLDIDTHLGHPSWDEFDRQFWTLGYEYEHQFNDAWAFRQNARYMRSLIDRNETWWTYPPTLPVVPGMFPNGAAGDGTDDFVLAYGRDRDNDSQTFSIDNQLVGHFDTDNMANTVLIGASFDRLSFDQTQYVGMPPNTQALALNDYQPINIFDPQWASAPRTSRLASDDEITQNLAGLYGQWQLKSGGWIALLGARYDWAKSEYDNRLASTNTEGTDHEVTWQTGVMYQFENGISPYISYATTFVPVQQFSTATGGTFDPITGDQAEIGVKYAPEGAALEITAATYRMIKEDDVTYDSKLGEYRQIGKSEAEGAELEVKAQVTDNLQMTAAYTYVDTRIKDDAGSRYEDKQITGVPRHQASIWGSYRFYKGPLDGLMAGLGVRYLGSSYGYPGSGQAKPTLKTEDQVLVDALLGYQINANWSTKLNVQNLFDEEYVAQCNNAGRCYWGAERTINGTVSYHW